LADLVRGKKEGCPFKRCASIEKNGRGDHTVTTRKKLPSLAGLVRLQERGVLIQTDALPLKEWAG